MRNLEGTSLVKSAYEEAFKYKHDSNTYLGKVSAVLDKYGTNIDGVNWYELQGEMKQKFEEMWSNILNKNSENGFTGNKLRFYRTLKTKFEYEQYLNVLTNPQQRAMVTRLRTSSHKLNIEVGRHRNIPVNERKCQQCDLNQVEDEHHFIFKCSKYENHRREFMTQCQMVTNNFNLLTDEEKLYYIFNSDPDMLKIFGCFVSKSFELRP